MKSTVKVLKVLKVLDWQYWQYYNITTMTILDIGYSFGLIGEYLQQNNCLSKVLIFMCLIQNEGPRTNPTTSNLLNKS